jgi:GNAT superfamily N-acetyltransferase
LVVLPDFQGVGIGMKILNEIAKHYWTLKKTVGITSSVLNLKKALLKSDNWIMKRQGRVSKGSGKIQNKNKKNSTSTNRETYSFEFRMR